MSAQTLEEFTAEVMWNFGLHDLQLEVVDLEGKHPIVPALEHETLATVMRRVMMFSGGYANLFVKGVDSVRQASFLPSTEAISEESAEDMIAEPPAGWATIGAFLDYLETQQHGVTIPALLPLPTAARASNVRPVTLEAVSA